jgi:hypothetical protein
VDIEFLSLFYAGQGTSAVWTLKDYGFVYVMRLLEGGIANLTEILAFGAVVIVNVVVGSTTLGTGYVFRNILVITSLDRF